MDDLEKELRRINEEHTKALEELQRKKEAELRIVKEEKERRIKGIEKRRKAENDRNNRGRPDKDD